MALPTKPSTPVPTWATDTNYTNGDDVGLTTKVEPTTGEKAEGHYRGKRPPARKVNWLKHWICQWLKWAEDALDGHEISIVNLQTFSTTISAEVAALGPSESVLEPVTNPTSLSGISAVSTGSDAIIAIKRGNHVMASAHFSVTNSVSGDKSFEFDLPYMEGNFAQQYHLSGHGAAFDAAGGATVHVFAVVGTQRARAEWTNAPSSGNTPVRLTFGYYISP